MINDQPRTSLYPQPDVDTGTAPRLIRKVDVNRTAPGTLAKYLLHIVTDGMGMPIYVPVMVARGVRPGPVVGVTAAVHGNELNGIPVIHRLMQELDPSTMSGTVVGIPGVNMPSLLRKQRRFIDGVDLNHIMPGRADGTVSQVYAYRVFERIARRFDFLFDLHTASFGRVNSYYIRADMSDAAVCSMVQHQGAQIVVHNPPGDGTLRGAAASIGIPAITLEVGDPNKFQRGMIRQTVAGIHNFLVERDMVEGVVEDNTHDTVHCTRSYWMYADTGGILTVSVGLAQHVKKDEPVATLLNAFGEVVSTYTAPENGIVIGHSISPVCQTGGRILHLGITG